MELNIILENGDGELWGRLKADGFLLTTVGKNRTEVTNNLRQSLIDYLVHEGKENDFWKNINIDDVNFIYQYDLSAFFDVFQQLKISSIAKMADLNESLVRQYSKGLAFASDKQVAKIQTAVRNLGKELINVQFV